MFIVYVFIHFLLLNFQWIRVYKILKYTNKQEKKKTRHEFEKNYTFWKLIHLRHIVLDWGGLSIDLLQTV